MPKPEIHLPIRYDLVIIERYKPWEGEAIFADFPTPLALQGLGTLFLWEGEFQVAGRRLFPRVLADEEDRAGADLRDRVDERPVGMELRGKIYGASRTHT